MNDQDQEDLPSPPLPPSRKGHHNPNPAYKSSQNQSHTAGEDSGGLGVSSQTRSKTNSNTTTATKSREIGKKETNRDELLLNMKNYDRNWFHFGNVLGSGRLEYVFTTTLCGKTGALKMVDLYKNEDRLKNCLMKLRSTLDLSKKFKKFMYQGF